jgi:hypothetical protein
MGGILKRRRKRGLEITGFVATGKRHHVDTGKSVARLNRLKIPLSSGLKIVM